MRTSGKQWARALRQPALWLATLLALCIAQTTMARQWTLADCLRYAMENNITLRKSTLQQESAEETHIQSRRQLLPSLQASTSHSGNYTPWVESGISGDGYSRASVDKGSYNGTYSLMGSYTIFDGNKSRNQAKLNQLAVEEAEINTELQAKTIEEQIAQLYVQILYSQEAVTVNKEILQTSITNEKRGEEMVRVGKMSKADLAQLASQRAQDEYNVVSAETNVMDFKRQMRQLLQLTDDEPFDVAVPETTDSMATAAVPQLEAVYTAALGQRPEMRLYRNRIDQSEMSIKIAKAEWMPTISANAQLSTSTTSMNTSGWGSQMKNNFSAGGGLTISMPIYDRRQARTNVNKAQIQRQEAMLDLEETQTKLHSTIENYWLQATTNQSKFKAAQASVMSSQASYDLLTEQFRLGLKNISELNIGKDTLLQAKQNMLQSKYLSILNLDMLKFYQDGTIRQ